MAYKPFLSHKRQDASELESLKAELCLRGAGGWQDVEELRTGSRFRAALVKAIKEDTGGFIWYATRDTLQSDIIMKIELPEALKRARVEVGGYPLVPVFVELRPEDHEDIAASLGPGRARELLDYNGVVREVITGSDGVAEPEDLALFHKRAAQRYVRDLIRCHGPEPLRIAIVGGRPPTHGHDLSLDWRGYLDDGRLRDPTLLPTLIETLTDIRDAAHEVSDCPEFVVAPQLRLPLAALVGWEWHRVHPVKLTVVQPGATPLTIDDLRCNGDAWPTPQPEGLQAEGPAVIAVSVGKQLGNGARRYAAERGASELTTLHLPLDEKPGQALSERDICELAQWTVNRLAEANSRGKAKHLLLLGPVSLAVRIGASANGTGRTFMPFWDGGAGYDGGVEIG